MPLVGEYLAKKQLAKLGYTQSYDSLSQFDYAVNMFIDNKISELKQKELKKIRNKK